MTHIVSVVSGISAAMVFVAGFYVAGLVLIPQRWSAALGFASFPVIGASFYVVVCVAAITVWRIPLTGLTALFMAGLAILAALRFRDVKAAIAAHLTTRTFAAGVLAFAVFYSVAYVMARPSTGERFLPPALPEHIDLITYARYARHLLLFGSPDLEGPAFDFRRSPAVAVVLAGFSAFFRNDPLRAAVPLHLAMIALIGIAALNLCRSLFKLSAIPSLTIAVIVLTSPYVSDLAHAYHLETTMAAAIVLYLIWATATMRADVPESAVALSLGSGYVLLLLTVAAALPAVLVMQAVLIGARMFASETPPRIAFAGAAALAVALVAFEGQVRWSVAHLTLTGAFASAGIAFAILLLGGLAYLAFNVDWRMRLSTADQRLVTALPVYLGIALILANVAARASEHRPAPTRIPAGWQNIERLKERSPRQLTMKLGEDPSAFRTPLTRYYLPATKLEVIPPGFPIPDYGAASREHPLLIQNFWCEAAGHADAMAIPDVGCALFAPPSVALDTVYPFNRQFLAVEFYNMSDPEPGGRWTTGKPLPLSLIADPERTRVDRHLHVNLLLDPSFSAGAAAQRLEFMWGAQKRAVAEVSQPGWVSIPVSTADWSRNRVWVLPIS
ncbi:MAG: hypothetical protein ABIS29_05155, partial [Vicinamibacterales bacterium]